jgi:hypothetical protein
MEKLVKERKTSILYSKVKILLRVKKRQVGLKVKVTTVRNEKQHFRICNWNTRLLRGSRQLENVKIEMRKMSFFVLGNIKLDNLKKNISGKPTI